MSGTLTVRDGDKDGDGVGDSAEVAAGTDPNNPADRPMVLSAGWNHTLFVPVPGQTALAWGINTDGRCGLGHTNSPITSGVKVVGVDGVTALSNIIAVAAGGNHSLVLTRSGGSTQVWAAGTNANGQLGLTNTGTDRFRPISSGLPTNITALAAGAKHSLALAADGKLYAWGDNISGQIGVNTNRTVIRAPTLVSNLGSVTVKAIGAGAEHSLALGADGRVWSWGRPNGGALGYAGINPVRVPQPVTALTKKVVQIAAGDRHSLFLTEDGEVYASGINSAGQLGLPASVVSASTPTKLTFPDGTVIRKLVTGLNRAHAIAANGKVFAWGYNRYGELGLGVATTAEPFAVFIPTEVPALYGSKEIAGGGFQTFALDASGTLLASGLNDGGQLGVGSTNTVTTNAPAPTKQAGKIDQTLTFSVPAGPFSTATTLVLGASSNSGLNPVYTSSDPAVARVDGSTLQFLAAGTVRITATQPGDDTRNAATPVSRTLTVAWDTTRPGVTLNGPAVINLYVGDTFTDPGATALDPVDGVLTEDILVTGFVNTAMAGSYTLTYQVQDAAGNLGEAFRTVVVSEPPPLTLQLAATPAEMTYQPVGTNEVAVDSGLQILGRPSIALSAATVQIVTGRQIGDRLALSGYTGPITASYNSNSGTLRLSGTTNLAGYQEALRKVVLATTNRTLTNRVLTMALGTGIAFTNGHVYEYVGTTADWPAARNAAKARQINGVAGYLANVTSAGENAFLLGLLQEAAKDAWLGGSDTAGTGYRWFDGPEAGTLFWNGVGNGGSAVSGQYSNWGAGEPNDFGWSTGLFSTTYESYAMMTYSTSFVIGGWTRATSPGKWNDAPLKTSSSASYRLGYLVEYGSSSTTGLLFAATRTIEVVRATPSITALPTATAITTGQTLNASTLSGGGASVPGTFAWSVPTTVPPAGTNSYGVTFTPADTANYVTVALEVPVTAESAPTGPLFASYHNETYPFSTTVPTLTVVGTNLDQATKLFKLVNTTPLMGEFTLPVLSIDPSQVTLSLPTSTPSGTYYVIYDFNGSDEKILGYLNFSSLGGGVGTGDGTGSGTGGGGMGPASVPDAMALAEPTLTLSSGSGGITTLSVSVGPASVQMLFSYSRPEGGSYVDGRYAVDGLWYEVQQSTNLGSWAGVAAQEVATIPLENGWERVTVRVSASGNQAFLRLKISN
ncbi:MAG: DUF5011 domain-containing protein [Verrucomicrobia bacterium]|nr:DUF5011 domain-containing protein [Verrucomicrobiota bacterium]